MVRLVRCELLAYRLRQPKQVSVLYLHRRHLFTIGHVYHTWLQLSHQNIFRIPDSIIRL